MPPSKLPYTGRCHFCNKPTEKKNCFCSGTNCQRLYWYHRENGKPSRMQQAQHPRKTENERIWAVCVKAYHAGTLMNLHTRMVIEKSLQSGSLVPQ